MLLLASAIAAATPAEAVFGIPFGQPLSLPVCPDPQPGVFSPFPSVTCQDPNVSNYPDGRKLVVVKFSEADLPPIVKRGQLDVTLLNGAVAGFSVDTGGVEDQAIALRMLTEKYGKPSVQTSMKVQNMMGASFDSVIATWKTHGLAVALQGTTTSLKDGRVTIDTPSVAALRAATEHKATGRAL